MQFTLALCSGSHKQSCSNQEIGISSIEALCCRSSDSRYATLLAFPTAFTRGNLVPFSVILNSYLVAYWTVTTFLGGFLHGLHNLTYGVDLLGIRWMGVLQVGYPQWCLHMLHRLLSFSFMMICNRAYSSKFAYKLSCWFQSKMP